MYIVVTCIECTRQLRLPRETLGRTVRCPLCKATFLTHETSEGHAEAIPLAQPAAPPTAPPAAPPPKPAVPNLSLDDEDVPIAPLLRPIAAARPESVEDLPLEPLRVRDEDEDIPDAKILPPRLSRQRDEDERPRRRRRDEEEDEDDRPAPPQRRQRESSWKPVAFALRIVSDPNGRLEGRFNAAVDDEGLHIWRGKGRVIDVPTKQKLKHVEGARLLLPIEGRDVEVTVIEPDGRSIVLAERIAAFFAGQEDSVALPPPPRKSAGAVGWMVFAPIGIPLLAVLGGHAIGGVVGGLLWGVLGLALVGIAALFLFGTSWSARTRGLSAGSAIVVGYVCLGCGFLFDRSATPAMQRFRPAEGGFAVDLPGRPNTTLWNSAQMRGEGVRLWEVRLPSGTTYSAGLAELKPEAVRDRTMRERLGMVSNALTASAPNTFIQNEKYHPGSALGQAAVEWQVLIGAGGAGGLPERHGVARLVANGRHVLILYMTSDERLSPNSPEVRQFFASARLDDLPNDATVRADLQPPLPPVEPPVQPPVVPPVQLPVQPPTENLGPNAKILSKGQYLWAGFSADGKTIAAVTSDRKVTCWDGQGQVRYEETLRPPPGSDRLHHAAISADGRWLALAYDNFVSLVETRAGGDRKALEPRDEEVIHPRRVAFTPDGKTLVTTHSNGELRLWDLNRPGSVVKLPLGTVTTGELSLSPDGKRAAVAGGSDQKVHLIDLIARKPLDPITNKGSVRSSRRLAFAADNSTLAVGSALETRVLDANTGELKREIRSQDRHLALAFHPAGRVLALGTQGGQVVLVRADSGEYRGVLRDPERQRSPREETRSLSFSSSGNEMVVCLAGRVELWQVDRQVTLRGEDLVPPVVLPSNLTRFQVNLDNARPRLGGLLVSRNGAYFAPIPADTTRTPIYSEATLKIRAEVNRQLPSLPLAFSPAGRHFAVGTLDGKIQLHHGTTGNREQTLEPSTAFFGGITALAFSDDGTFLVSGNLAGSGGEVRLWDLARSKETHRFPCRSIPRLLAVSPDGLTVAAATQTDKRIRLHECATGREYSALVGLTANVKHLAYSQDGKYLAAVEERGVVRLFDTKRCRQAFILNETKDEVTGLSFSPDNTTLALGGPNDTARLIDIGSGKEVHRLKHDAAVVGVGFGPGGNTLIVASATSVNRWKLSDVAELQKRPPAVTPDFDKSSPPELPELEPAGRIESHLCHVIDPKAGYLLAFTRDRLCLHYSYPALTLKGAFRTEAVVYRAALDPEKGVVYAATSPPAALIVAGRQRTSLKTSMHVYDLAAVLSGKVEKRQLVPTALVPGDRIVYFVGVSSQGTPLYVEGAGTLGEKMRLMRLDPRTHKPSEISELNHTMRRAAMTPDRKFLYLAGTNPRQNQGVLQSFDLTSLKAVAEQEIDVVPVDLSVSGERLVVTNQGGSTLSLNLPRLDSPATLRIRGMTSQVRVVGERVYSLENLMPPALNVFDLARSENGVPILLARIESPPEEPFAGDFTISHDGQFLLAQSGHAFRLKSRELMLPRALKDVPKEKADAPKGKLKSQGSMTDPHTQRVLALAWAPSGQMLLTGGADQRLVTRLVDTGKVVRQTREGSEICSVAWSRDDRFYAAGRLDGQCYVVALREQFHRGLSLGSQHRSFENSIALSGKGETVAGAGEKGLILWHGPQFATRSVAGDKPLTAVAVAAGAPVGVASGEDGLMRVYDLTEAKEKAALKGHDGSVLCVAIGPDAKLAISGGVDGKVKVWDIAAGKETFSLDHGVVVLSVAFADDGKLIASGGIDGTVKLWDATTGKVVIEEPAMSAYPVQALAFSPDGKSLAVGVGSEVRRFDTATMIGALVKLDIPRIDPKPPSKEPVVPKPVVPKSGEPLPVGKEDVGETVARLGTVRDIAIDPKGKQALVASSVGQLRRYRYPEFTQTGAYRIESYSFRIFVDSERQRLLQVKTARNMIEVDGKMRGDDAELVIYDIKDLKPNTAKTSTKSVTLASTDRVKLEGKVGDVALSPDGKSLYVIDIRNHKLTKLDLTTLKAVKSVAVTRTVTGMCQTADGKSLWVISVEGKDKGALTRFEADLTQKSSHALDFAPTDVVATDKGRLCLLGGNETNRLAVVMDSAKAFREIHRGILPESAIPSLALAGDQSAFYVLLRVRQANQTTMRIIPATKDTGLADLPLYRVTGGVSALDGEMHASPDGTFLILRSGSVIRVRK